MEGRKLNFNAPLLSVRRSNSPIKWKNVENSQLSRQHSRSSNKVDSRLDQVTEPVAVPFHWEKIPGKAKDGRISEHRIHEKASAAPRMPSGKKSPVMKRQENRSYRDMNSCWPSVEVKSFDDKVGTEYPKEELSKKVGVRSEKEDGNDDDDDDVYSDALDTLLPADSVSMSCSVNGLSSSDGHAVKSSGNFFVDPQTRDFMMSRFLPAAKAMTLEPAHYASRKKSAAVDKPRPITTLICQDREPPVCQQDSNDAPQCTTNLEEAESEDESEKHDNSGNITIKGCGLVPRLSFKNSLCILNPITGLKFRNQISVSSSKHVEKPSKAAAYIRPQSPIPSSQKPLKDDVYKPKSYSGVLSPRLLEVENKLRTYGSNRFTDVSERQTMSRTSSPLRRSAGTSPLRRSGCISPYRNERLRSPFQEVGFLGIPKEADNSKVHKLSLYVKSNIRPQEQSDLNSEKLGSCSVNPSVEKKLYVDTGNKTTKLSGNISEANSGISSRRNGFKASLEKSRELEETASTESVIQDAGSHDVNDEERNLEYKVITTISPSRSQDKTEDSRGDSKVLACIDGSIDSDQVRQGDDSENAKTSLVPYHPFAALLPKKPSESWLWRTLPSISKASSKLYHGGSFHSARQDSRASCTNAKWETIVKSSYLHHDRVRYSEELIPHPSQQSKN